MLEETLQMDCSLSPDAYLRGIFMNYMVLFPFFRSNVKKLYLLMKRGLRFTLKSNHTHTKTKALIKCRVKLRTVSAIC